MLFFKKSPADFVRSKDPKGLASWIESSKGGGASIEARSDGWTALMWAAHLSDLPCLDLLIEAGADPMAQDSNGWDALFWAADAGDASVVGRLLAAGADPCRTDSMGRLPHQWAASQGRSDASKILEAAFREGRRAKSREEASSASAKGKPSEVPEPKGGWFGRQMRQEQKRLEVQSKMAGIFKAMRSQGPEKK